MPPPPRASSTPNLRWTCPRRVTRTASFSRAVNRNAARGWRVAVELLAKRMTFQAMLVRSAGPLEPEPVLRRGGERCRALEIRHGQARTAHLLVRASQRREESWIL